jgi:hypothetical protein
MTDSISPKKARIVLNLAKVVLVAFNELLQEESIGGIGEGVSWQGEIGPFGS